MNFDAYTCDLTGKQLVEAGAGTGKTYNIQILFLRLIIEKKVPVEKILVVTFTELATAELRERLRRILNSMKTRLEFAIGNPNIEPENADPQVEAFFRNNNGFFWGKDKTELEDALQLVVYALRGFDTAPVSTIHGFCSSMLRENAFESGIRYGMKVRTDCSKVVNDAMYDFWREQCYSKQESADVSVKNKILQALNYSPNTLVAKIKDLLNNQGVGVYWGNEWKGDSECTESKLVQLEGTIKEKYEELRSIITNPKLQEIDITYFKNPFGIVKELQLDKLLDAGLFFSPTILEAFLSIYKMLTAAGKDKAEEVKTALEKNEDYMAFFNIANSVYNLMKKYDRLVVYQAYNYVIDKVGKIKALEGFMTFNDMLWDLERALANDSDNKLRDAIRGKFDAAFVDEFQDTDPIQYSIFEKLFAESPNHVFFMIGDPKQAIYKFRGGDIYAYIKASSACAIKNYLDCNYRSSANYISAMNAFFDNAKDFFVNSAIQWNEIKIPDNNSKHLYYKGQDVTPEKLLSIIKTDLDDEIVREIKYMVDNPDITITDGRQQRRLKYGDIAVLVRVSKSGEKIEKDLRKAGIPCVWNGGINVFSRGESNMLEMLVDGVLDAGSQSKAIRIISSSWFGLKPNQIDFIRETHMVDVQSFLVRLEEKWRKTSFQGMLSAVLEATQKEVFSLSESELCLFENNGETPLSLLIVEMIDGFDSIAVLRQLGDVLHRQAVEERMGHNDILKFLKKKNKAAKKKSGKFGYGQEEESETVDTGEDDEPERYEMRMTTQDSAVKIMTIHKSKGLEFPIVFLPDLIKEKSSESKWTSRIYHEDNKRMVNMDDLNSDKSAQAKEEEFHESRRLLYVAITRAVFLCRFLQKCDKSKAVKQDDNGGKNSGNTNEGNSRSEEKQGDSILPVAKKGVLLPNLSIEYIFPMPENESNEDAFPALPDNCGDDGMEQSSTVKADVFTGEIRMGWQTCSFSSINRATKGEAVKKEAEPEEAEARVEDFDEDDAGITGAASGISEQQGNSAEQGEKAPIFLFPTGARAGECWHSIFEAINFQSDPSERAVQLEKLLSDYKQLPRYGKREAMLKAFNDMVTGVLENELGDGICLKDILPEYRLHEMRFVYKLGNGFRTSAFVEDMKKAGIKCPENWSKNYGKSFAMTGAIDLLFQARNEKYYILDWKTNFLHADFANFDEVGLKREMDEKFYTLQYLIYTVAFLQYYKYLNKDWVLSENEYDRIFGGVFYLFLRGISKEDRAAAESRRGIFFARPPFDLVWKLYSEIGVKQQ